MYLKPEDYAKLGLHKLKKLQPDVWKNTSFYEKLNTLQAISNKVCDLEQRPRTKLEVNTDLVLANSQYKSETNTIFFSFVHLSHNSVYHAVRGLAHALTYAYRDHAITNHEFHKDRQELSSWVKEYIPGIVNIKSNDKQEIGKLGESIGKAVSEALKQEHYKQKSHIKAHNLTKADIKDFHPERWKHLNIKERFNALQTLVNKIAEKEGRTFQRVAACHSGLPAQHYAKERSILVSHLHLYDKNPYKILSSVLTENLRAYQRYAISHPKHHANTAEVRQWKRTEKRIKSNSYDYVGSNDPTITYAKKEAGKLVKAIKTAHSKEQYKPTRQEIERELLSKNALTIKLTAKNEFTLVDRHSPLTATYSLDTKEGQRVFEAVNKKYNHDVGTLGKSETQLYRKTKEEAAQFQEQLEKQRKLHM